MATRRRKRRSKKRKASSRKRARRPVSRTRAKPPSSDEDFVLDSDGEDSSSGSAEQEDNSASADDGEQEEEDDDDDDDDDEEEENDVGPSYANSGLSAGTQRRRLGSGPRNGIVNGTPHPSKSRRRRRRRKEESSDEDFNADAERDSDNDVFAGEDNVTGGEGQPANHTSRPFPSRSRHSRWNTADENLDMDAERAFETNAVGELANNAPRPARKRRPRHRRRGSSDEDFDVDMERVLENGGIANEGVVATRPVTRAMDSGQLTGPHAEGSGNFLSDSLQNVARHLTGSLDTLLQGTLGSLRAREPSLKISDPQESSATPAGRGRNAGKDAEIDKRKGKEKVLEGEDLTARLSAGDISHSNAGAINADGQETAVVCGICLTETALVERGKLDCCDHFFCFGCIMEWAKVESRCPMCKQRFVTIAKSGCGISKRTRTVRIPTRNQVYIPPEDQDLPPEDPYADIVCMECRETGDEGLLLLCDRCDSAAHTFCVGLGRSVPHGDWYCRDCQALIGESEDEAEELVLASSGEEGDEEDVPESLLRSIVASAIPERQRTRQTRVQRVSTSTSRSLPVPRRRLGAGVRRRLLRRLTGRRGGRPLAAPQLSQAARAFLSSTPTELNQVLRVAEAPQNGSARTVPQQRRLQERINVMRNNWGRIQTGDLQFDTLGTPATAPIQPAVSSSRNAAPIPPAPVSGSPVSNNIAVDSAEPSIQGNRDLERAWKMMGHAQNLSAGIGSSKTQQQKSAVSHQGPSPSAQQEVTQPTTDTTSRAINYFPCTASKNLDIPTNSVPSSSLGKGDVGINRGLSSPSQIVSSTKDDETFLGQRKNPRVPLALTTKPGECRKEELPCSSNSNQTLAAGTFPIDCHKVGINRGLSSPSQIVSGTKHDETPSGQRKNPRVPLALTTKPGECRKEELPCASNSKQTLAAGTFPDCHKDSCGPSRSADGRHTLENVSNGERKIQAEPVRSSSDFGRRDAGRAHTLTGNTSMTDRQGAFVARENIVANSSSPPPEGLKVHLTELVKKQTWPVYIAERLDKEQFKRIARAAVHSLLALCDPNSKSVSLSCGHVEDHGNNPVVNCCNKCLDQHVEKAVKIAKDRIIPG